MTPTLFILGVRRSALDSKNIVSIPFRNMPIETKNNSHRKNALPQTDSSALRYSVHYWYLDNDCRHKQTVCVLAFDYCHILSACPSTS